MTQTKREQLASRANTVFIKCVELSKLLVIHTKDAELALAMKNCLNALLEVRSKLESKK